ncbi:hypothetical protein LINGRAHAP2_LOCUS6317 [Linum grandiflorum]
MVLKIGLQSLLRIAAKEMATSLLSVQAGLDLDSTNLTSGWESPFGWGCLGMVLATMHIYSIHSLF